MTLNMTQMLFFCKLHLKHFAHILATDYIRYLLNPNVGHEQNVKEL